MNVQKFWTITDSHCEGTNSRSKHFPTKIAAVQAAGNRLAAAPSLSGVIVMEAVTLVERSEPPVTITEITE